MNARHQAYYPAFLVLEGRPCVVVGGGKVAQRKTNDLLSAGAAITVISPKLTAPLKRLKASGKITHKARAFRPMDLDNVFLAVAATDNEEVNLLVAERKDLLVNIVDHPELCTFIVPASFRRGPLNVAVSTSGASPALAREIRKDLESRYGSNFGQYLRKLNSLRQRATKAITDPAARERFLRSLASTTVFKKLLRGLMPPIPQIPPMPKTPPSKPSKPNKPSKPEKAK